jgi:alkanesulfonate monooxygenase SsuD/methylene tetrahydromethanopterin reductase-like flavin-dependent oxidoreductase (luciferase family)
MKFGYVCNPARLDFKGDYMAAIQPIRDIAAFCDDNGLDSIWLGEHHFGFYGRANLPNPLMMAADLAARTKRLKIGLASATITLWHPLRLAEDVALVDQLSGGRLIMGVGRGNHAVEFDNINPMADPRVPEDNMAVFEETLEILKRALSQESFSFKGKKYTFPRPGFTWDTRKVTDPRFLDAETGEVNRVPLMPPPRQRPYPPMWQMVDSDRSIQFAGANDLGIVMWRPTVQGLKKRFTLYRESAQAAGLAKAWGEGTGIMRDMFVAETMEKAREIAGGPVMKHLNWSNWRGPGLYLDPGETLAPEREAQLKKSLDYDWVHPRSLLFGSPDYVAERLIEMRETLNIERVLVNSTWEGVSDEDAMKSLRLFTEKVLPKL